MEYDNFHELINIGALPLDIKLMSHELVLERCITVDDFLKLDYKKKFQCKKFVIANNSIWVALHKSGVWSCDKDGFIYKTSINNALITRMGLHDNRLKPENTKTMINLKEKYNYLNKEEKKMADNQNSSAANKAVQDALSKMGINPNGGQPAGTGNPATGGVQNSTSFQNGGNPNNNPVGKPKENKPKDPEKEAKKAAAKKRAKEVEAALSANLEKVELADATQLYEFNRAHGRIEFYVVPNEAKLRAKTRKVKKEIGGKPILTEAAKADPAKLAAYAANDFQSLKSSDFEKVPELEIAHNASVQPKQITLSIPEGGIPTDEELNKAEGIVDFDDTKTDKILFHSGKDLAVRQILKYFGGEIYEADRTVNGVIEKGRKIIGANFIYSKDIKEKNEATGKMESVGKVSATKYVIGPDGGGRLVQPWNSVPRKRFLTVDWASLFSTNADKKQQAVNSLFATFFNPRANKSTIYDDLGEKSKAKLSKDEATGNITSTLFDSISDTPVVKSAFSTAKNPVTLSKLEIPLRDDNGLGSYIEFDILSDRNPDSVAGLNPDTDPAYEEIRKVLPKGVTLKDVVALAFTKENSGKTTTRGRLSASDSRKLAFLEEKGKLTAIDTSDITGVKGTSEYNRYLNQVYAINKKAKKDKDKDNGNNNN